MEKKETIILHRGQIESLLSLSSLRDVKTILRAIVSYGMDEVNPEIPEHLAFGWLWFKHTIDHHREQYHATVEARRIAGKASAEKRKTQHMPANPTNVDFVEQNEQVPANPTNSTDYEYDYDNNYTLSRACAYAGEAETIAGLFPRAKVGDHRQLVLLVIDAVQKEIDNGKSQNEALSIVRSGTQKYAKAMAEKPKMFLAKPEDFYGKGQYNFDPEVWEKQGGSVSAGKNENKKYDFRDPSTWKPKKDGRQKRNEMG